MTEQEIVRNILEKKGCISNVMFVACGGSIAAFYASKFFLESESKNLNRVGYYSSNEFVHATPKSLQNTSLVIACSHQGDTPETVEAIKKAKSMGATTVAFTYAKGSEITKFGDYEIVYDWGPNSSVADQKMSKGLKLSMEILHQTEHWDGYEAAMDGRDIEVAVCGTVWANADRFVGKANVHQVAVYLGVYRNGFDAQLLARAENTQGDFTAVCDQNFF